MTKVWLLLAAAALTLPNAHAAAAKERKAAVAPKPIEVKRSLFSGSESRLFDFGWLRPDCTSPGADVRIVKPPSKGGIRLEEARTVVAANKSAVQKLCHGKALDSVRLFYKANDNDSGKDTFLLDVDTKLGYVQRYAFTVDVR
jgi:hypothetical protein